MDRFQMTFQGIQVVGPVAPVAPDPFVDLDQAVGTQRVDPALSIRSDLYQADLPKHPQVAGHRGLGQAGQGGNQLARGSLTAGERIEQCAPAGFGNRLEDVHATSIALCLYRRNPI